MKLIKIISKGLASLVISTFITSCAGGGGGGLGGGNGSVNNNIEPYTCILIKGSRPSKLEEYVEFLKTRRY